MTPGFLLTRQWQDTPQGIRLDFWLCTEQGPLQVSIRRQQAIFFILRADAERAASLLKSSTASIKPLELQTFKFDAVSGVYFDAQAQLYRARDLLTQHGIPCYEDDIRPPERFLTERFITASIDVDASYSRDVLLDRRLQPGGFIPDFKLMSVDIESDYQTDSLFSIAFVSSQHQKTLIIGEGGDSKTVEYLADESALLARWIEWVEIVDPDIYIGWNVVNFDFRLLQKRALALDIPLTIGRGRSVPVWRKAQTDTEHYFISIPGRVVLDGIDTLKSATYNLASFSLEAVSQELLGRGKLIEGEAKHDPLFKAKEIQRQFHQDKAALAAYNLEDCQLVWDIFEKADLISFSIERARLTGLEMDKVGGSVAAFDNLYLPRLHRKGFIAPNIGDYQGDLSAPGGYVMDSEPGLHDSVLVLDYKSLYPSIIRTFKVDPYGRIAAKLAEPSDIVPGYDGASFSKSENILPDIIATLWQARDQAKRDGNAALSQAIKIIMNSFYGVLGTSGCRIHDSRLTSSITKRSHAIILQTVKLIEAEGYKVIYGDTDSVFVSLQKSCDNEVASEIGNRLVGLINRYWVDHLRQDYDIESYLEMELETHFNQFFMPTVRGSDQGSKKRYAGLIDDGQGQRTIHYKGLETVRTDWTELARQFQKNLYRRVFDGKEYGDYIRHTVENLRDGKFDNALIYRKRLRKKLSEYVKNVPPHAQAAIKAEAIFNKCEQPSRYRNKSWIEYVITVNGAEALECQTSKLDYEHYIEKQLTPIVDTILNAIGSSMEAVTGRQRALF
ncbi:MAG: DNA polymerase II [Gammaproteobacteria bacterium]|nr:MAG: DNA polymerase II [Gammaproteobacteria bacterium]